MKLLYRLAYCIALIVLLQQNAFAACCKPTGADRALQNMTFIVDMALAPEPLAGLADQLFCLNYFAGHLYQVDPAEKTCLLVTDNLTSPHGLALHQNGAAADAYIAEMKSGRVVKINLLTGWKSIVAEGLNRPARLAIMLQEGAVAALYVTQLLEGSVVRLTPAAAGQLWQQEIIARNIALADGIAIEPGGATALVGSFWGPGFYQKAVTGKITRIDLESGLVHAELADNRLWFPAQLALGEAASGMATFFVSEMLGNKVTQLSCTAEGLCSRQKSFRMKFPTGICLSADGKRLFAVESFSGLILGIDTLSGERDNVMLLRPFTIGRQKLRGVHY